MRSSHARPAWADTPIVGREYLKEASRCMIQVAPNVSLYDVEVFTTRVKEGHNDLNGARNPRRIVDLLKKQSVASVM